MSPRPAGRRDGGLPGALRVLPLTGTPGTMTRRLLAMTLVGQALTIVFGALVARGFAVADGDSRGGAVLLAGGGALAVLAVLTAGMLRRRWGITLGWLVQLLTLLSAVVLPAMVGVALVFGGLWVLCLVQGHRLEDLAHARTTAPEGAPPRQDRPTATDPKDPTAR